MKSLGFFIQFIQKRFLIDSCPLTEKFRTETLTAYGVGKAQPCVMQLKISLQAQEFLLFFSFE
jgi:hypothetical protein